MRKYNQTNVELRQQLTKWEVNLMTEEEVLERVEKAHKAYKSSTSKWAKNYWMLVISSLKRKYPTS